jgi:hypothetical protein
MAAAEGTLRFRMLALSSTDPPEILPGYSASFLELPLGKPTGFAL